MSGFKFVIAGILSAIAPLVMMAADQPTLRIGYSDWPGWTAWEIADKKGFMEKARQYLAPGGIVFVGFPAWQMPFGGHQQIAHSRLVSHLPFVHLLPRFLYKYLLQLAGESNAMIAYLIDVKETRTTIEMFQKIASEARYTVVDRRLYFVNPHYEIKFGLRPRLLSPLIARIPWVRNFFSTTCFYLLREEI